MAEQPCRPTCAKYGSHAFDCLNHPDRIPRPKHCKTCTCPKEHR